MERWSAAARLAWGVCRVTVADEAFAFPFGPHWRPRCPRASLMRAFFKEVPMSFFILAALAIFAVAVAVIVAVVISTTKRK